MRYRALAFLPERLTTYSAMNQQRILDRYGLCIQNMDIEATANSYVAAIAALQELYRCASTVSKGAVDDDRMDAAIEKAENLIVGAGFSL